VRRLNDLLARNRRQIDLDLRQSDRRAYISATALGQYRVTVPLAQRYVSGALIDLGCGTMPYRQLIESRVLRYDSLDPRPQVPDITYQVDVQDMAIVPSQHYDAAVCFEVLEHIPDPFKALTEIQRILKPSGVLVVSVPHLSRLHEEPHDYFRYTHYGLRAMFEQAGFDVIQIERRGGLLSFLSHQLSIALLGLTWSVPLLRQIVYLINAWLIVRPAFFLDSLIDRGGKFALGYTCVARRR